MIVCFSYYTKSQLSGKKNTEIFVGIQFEQAIFFFFCQTFLSFFDDFSNWSVVLISLHIFPGYTHSSTFYLHIHYYHHSTYVCNYPAEEFDWRVWNRLDDSLLLWETLICKLEMNEISLHTRRVKIPAAG